MIAVDKSTDQWEDLIRLLRTLSEEEIAAVQTVVEGLARRKVAVREAQVPYVVPVEAVEEVVHSTLPPQDSRAALLECVGIWEFEPGEFDEILGFLASGPPGFLPGELDCLLADIEHAREIELETPCQPT